MVAAYVKTYHHSPIVELDPLAPMPCVAILRCMSFLSKLFGGGSASKSESSPEIYKDFRIFVALLKDGSQYRVGARIEKDFNGETKSHQMIRADSFASEDQAAEVTLIKAKQFIDQQGDRIF